eukprot:206274-Pelagomonas_calceolata.AAC.4
MSHTSFPASYLECRAAKSSVESSSGSPWVIGSLVLYERKDGRVGLGLVQELQGKKNAFVLDGQVCELSSEGGMHSSQDTLKLLGNGIAFMLDG